MAAALLLPLLFVVVAAPVGVTVNDAADPDSPSAQAVSNNDITVSGSATRASVLPLISLYGIRRFICAFAWVTAMTWPCVVTLVTESTELLFQYIKRTDERSRMVGQRRFAVACGGPRQPVFAYKARLKSLLSARESSGRLELLLCRNLVIVNPN